MKTFSDVRDAIQQAWEFVIPPLRNLLIALGILWFISNRNIDPFLVINNFFTNLETGQAEAFVTRFKLEGTLPILGVLLLVFIVNLINRAIQFIGSYVPINNMVNFTFMYTDHYKFMDYWSIHPDITNANLLIDMIESRVEQEKLKNSNVANALKHIETESGRLYSLKTYIKFIIASLVGLLFADIWIPGDAFSTWRILLSLLVATIYLIYSFLRDVDMKRFQAEFYINTALSSELIASGKSIDYSKELYDKVFSMINNYKSRKWWYISLQVHQLRWMNHLKAFNPVEPYLADKLKEWRNKRKPEKELTK